MGAARMRLQATTKAIHEALHDAAPFAKIAQGQMNRAAYGALLSMLYRYHAAMADVCVAGAARLNAPPLAASHQLRLKALQADLAFCGERTAHMDRDAANDPDFAVGCLYTVQGSTLGGKLIHRQLDSLLPDGHGRSFFAGQADDGAHWRLFCEQLDACAPVLDMDRVEAGATFAFARFGNLLRETDAIAA